MASHTRRGTVFGSRDRGRLLRTCAPPSARGSLLGSSFVLPFWFGGGSEASPPSVVGTGRRHGSCGSPSAAGCRAPGRPGGPRAGGRRARRAFVSSRVRPGPRLQPSAPAEPRAPRCPVIPGPALPGAACGTWAVRGPPPTRGSDRRAGRRAAEGLPDPAVPTGTRTPRARQAVWPRGDQTPANAPAAGPGRRGSAVAPERLGTTTPPGLGMAKPPESVNLSSRWPPAFIVRCGSCCTEAFGPARVAARRRRGRLRGAPRGRRASPSDPPRGPRPAHRAARALLLRQRASTARPWLRPVPSICPFRQLSTRPGSRRPRRRQAASAPRLCSPQMLRWGFWVFRLQRTFRIIFSRSTK